MIHAIRHSVSNVKTARNERKAKQLIRRYGFRLRKGKDGSIAIVTHRMAWTIEFLPTVTFEERVEAIKWSLLHDGFVWTEDVEKYVRNALS